MNERNQICFDHNIIAQLSHIFLFSNSSASKYQSCLWFCAKGKFCRTQLEKSNSQVAIDRMN